MIKAVIFDCFGVLASEGWVPFRNQQFGADPAKLEQANYLMHQLVRGLITDEDFHEAVAELAETTPRTVADHMRRNVPDEEMFTFIQTLKPQYKTALLSNVGKNRLREIFSAEQLELIDVFALSSEIGYAKPDVAAYNTAAKRMGVMPDECVFVDDQPRYIVGGQAAGMQTVLFHDTRQAIRELRSLLSQSGA